MPGPEELKTPVNVANPPTNDNHGYCAIAQSALVFALKGNIAVNYMHEGRLCKKVYTMGSDGQIYHRVCAHDAEDVGTKIYGPICISFGVTVSTDSLDANTLAKDLIPLIREGYTDQIIAGDIFGDAALAKRGFMTEEIHMKRMHTDGDSTIFKIWINGISLFVFA